MPSHRFAGTAPGSSCFNGTSWPHLPMDLASAFSDRVLQKTVPPVTSKSGSNSNHRPSESRSNSLSRLSAPGPLSPF
uniref:Uncharacterized protein n=1 Tax=Picea sitchensis TaxID=3332 RepID=A0A6B9XUH8_PICSI|nr:hypothetical protein Q903MT_gene5804 [Picea sitchensis]